METIPILAPAAVLVLAICATALANRSESEGPQTRAADAQHARHEHENHTPLLDALCAVLPRALADELRSTEHTPA